MSKNLNHINHFIDISDEICPMTFVKTKLLIERMNAGETAEVRLQGREPLDNVPRSIEEYGHEILSLEKENESDQNEGIHTLVFIKR